MAEITAAVVKELREKTNAGMMDCKKALAEANGDMEAAIDILRKKGIASSTKRADREAKEGTVHAVLAGDKTGVLVEVNCETDFVAKNENFRGFVDTLAQHVAGTDVADGDVAAVLGQPLAGTPGTVDEAVKAKGGEIGENVILRRFRRFVADGSSMVSSYIHMGGRVGVLIEVAAGKAETLASDGLRALVKDLTLQIAAASPLCLNRADVPAAAVAKEKEIFAEQMQNSGKPANVIEKIVEGKLGKFYSQHCLLEQGFIKEPDQTVEDLINATGKALGDTITVKRFARYSLGEELTA